MITSLSQKITTLTSLICSKIDFISDTNLFLIAYYFLLLEEFDFINPTTFNFDINHMTISLVPPKLLKVDLSHNYFIFEKSLFDLFTNCNLVDECYIISRYCASIIGISYALGERPTLRSSSYSKSKMRLWNPTHFIFHWLVVFYYLLWIALLYCKGGFSFQETCPSIFHWLQLCWKIFFVIQVPTYPTLGSSNCWFSEWSTFCGVVFISYWSVSIQINVSCSQTRHCLLYS